MKTIDMMIIGSQKAATTSLKNYMGEHPQIVTHPHTEFAYFLDDKEFEKGYDTAYQKYFDSVKKTEPYKIVAKNVALHYTYNGLEHLARLNPHCQIVFILRNPVDRAISAYQMGIRDGWLKDEAMTLDTINKALEKNQQGKYDSFYRLILSFGFYNKQLEEIYKIFPKEQVSVFLYEEFKLKPTEVCQNLFEKLHVDTAFCPQVEKVHNKGGKVKSEWYAKIRKRLRDFHSVKQVVRNIIGEQNFQKIVHYSESVNVSTKPYEAVDSSVRHFLLNFYRSYNESCGKMINKDLSCWDK